MDRPVTGAYRVGRKLGRTVYRTTPDGDDELIGVMDTPELGAMVVEALNALESGAGHNGCCSMGICVYDRRCPGYARCTEEGRHV